MVVQKIRFICINALVALVLAAFLEIVLWAGLNYPQFIPSALLHSYREFYQRQDRSIIQVSPCAQYDPELFYTLSPGDCVFENREFSVSNHVNSRGLRDDEESLRAPEILVLGDSYAMGWGVQQDETFPQVLERLTNRKVLNAGISSYGTAREMILLKRLDIRKVKYLVIQYHPNDYEENVAYSDNDFHLRVRTEHQYDSLVEAIARRADYFPFKYLSGIAKGVVKDIIRPPRPDTANAIREAMLFLDILSRSLPVNDSLRIVVFKAETPQHLKDDRFTASLDSLARLKPYPWRDLTILRLMDFLSPDDYFILDDHINASGHRKIGRELSVIFHNESSIGTRILVKR